MSGTTKVRVAPRHALYGEPPAALVEPATDALQLSPLIPGSARFEDIEKESLAGLTVLAPAGTIERRYVLALGLRALTPGGRLVALAPKDKGGARLGKELAAFGCEVAEEARRHHRICTVERGEALYALREAIEEGAPRHIDNLALCTQPGVFSWNRLDPGSALLLRHLPTLSGRGADFGCGLGVLALAVLRSPSVTKLSLYDIDRRAAELAKRNVADSRVEVFWADLRAAPVAATSLDFVVMNPPFHDGGTEDQALGKLFISRAAESLRSGGTLWLTANAHLPYEAALKAAFRTVTPVAAEGGFKVFEARK